MEKWIENIITMKHIYLVNTKSRAANYGIGTYINQVIICLSQTGLCILRWCNLDLIIYAEDGMESLIDAFAERILAVLSSGQYKKEEINRGSTIWRM